MKRLGVVLLLSLLCLQSSPYRFLVDASIRGGPAREDVATDMALSTRPKERRLPLLRHDPPEIQQNNDEAAQDDHHRHLEHDESKKGDKKNDEDKDDKDDQESQVDTDDDEESVQVESPPEEPDEPEQRTTSSPTESPIEEVIETDLPTASPTVATVAPSPLPTTQSPTVEPTVSTPLTDAPSASIAVGQVVTEPVTEVVAAVTTEPKKPCLWRFLTGSRCTSDVNGDVIGAYHHQFLVSDGQCHFNKFLGYYRASCVPEQKTTGDASGGIQVDQPAQFHLSHVFCMDSSCTSCLDHTAIQPNTYNSHFCNYLYFPPTERSTEFDFAFEFIGGCFEDEECDVAGVFQ
mmetsp:Transcript_20236/g.36529  ORF Transcript_20236/g.36529 Transcript_20236/m.36529 type:complete len:347 (-) Transcript_20236:68-1108(-)